MEYDSAIKRMNLTTWDDMTDPEGNINILSEINRTEKTDTVLFKLYMDSKKKKKMNETKTETDS